MDVQANVMELMVARVLAPDAHDYTVRRRNRWLCDVRTLYELPHKQLTIDSNDTTSVANVCTSRFLKICSRYLMKNERTEQNKNRTELEEVSIFRKGFWPKFRLGEN